jgi:hypothetical protein
MFHRREKRYNFRLWHIFDEIFVHVLCKYELIFGNYLWYISNGSPFWCFEKGLKITSSNFCFVCKGNYYDPLFVFDFPYCVKDLAEFSILMKTIELLSPTFNHIIWLLNLHYCSSKSRREFLLHSKSLSSEIRVFSIYTLSKNIIEIHKFFFSFT